MKRYRIAAIPGDGIGREVIAQGIRVLDALAAVSGEFQLEWVHFPWGCDFYGKTGRMMPSDGLDQLRAFDAIYFGAVGDKSVPDHVSVWELILPIRRHFQQYVNLRPVKRLPGVPSPLIDNRDVDFLIIRENTEGEYANIGGHLHEATNGEVVIQTSVFTRMGVTRVARYAFEVASRRKQPLTVATKSNAMNYSMTFWDRVIREVSSEYPDVPVQMYHVDALAAYFVSRPHTFGVVLASNLFGDILSDLGAAVVGGLGVAPSANLNPERRFPSMFEPVHGSAPDIAGKGIANPIAAVWSGAMMLDFLGQPQAARLLMHAIESVLSSPDGRTPDLGGQATTEQVGDALIAHLHSAHGQYS
jgi:tartrate dehydrogenase/decarboxylase/D-malate dehydrogenase